MSNILPSTPSIRNKLARHHVHEKINNTPPSPFGFHSHQGQIVAEHKLELSLSSVEDMFRHVNLRDDPPGTAVAGLLNTVGSKSVPGLPDRTGDPANFPDAVCSSDRWLVMLHGYNVDGQEARGWHCEMFKRLYWSGNKARFVGVSWFGDPSPDELENIVQGYHWAVRNAVPTAEALAAMVNKLPGGAASKTVMGHSQGCWVSTLAVADFGMNIGNLCLLDAAFARECFDGENALDTTNMAPDEWQNYPEKTWAANWYKLFSASTSDARNGLTWRDRLVNALTNTTVHSFYSSTEDVLGAYAGTPTQAIVDNAFSVATQLDKSRFGNYAWVVQEKTKGAKAFYQGSNYGGWAFNLKDPFSPDDPVHWKWNYITVAREVKTPTELGVLPDDLLRRHPLFDPGWGGNVKYLMDRQNPPDPSTVSGAPAPMHDLYGTTGGIFVSMHRHQLLAEMIPATSLPVGANATNALLDRNYDMPIRFTNVLEWPRGEKDATGKANWRHSDVRDVAYIYVYKIFDKLTAISNQ